MNAARLLVLIATLGWSSALGKLADIDDLWRDQGSDFTCAGEFVLPDAWTIPTATDTTSLVIRSNRVVRLENGTTKIDGNVTVTQDGVRILTDQLHMDEKSNLLKIDAPFLILSKEYAVAANRGNVNAADRNFDLGNAEFVLFDSQFRGEAGSVLREDETTVLENISLTQCPPGSNFWSLHASKIVFRDELASLLARNMRLKLGRVPVFWVPRMSLPLDPEKRTDQFLPSIGYESDYGVTVSIPLSKSILGGVDSSIAPKVTSRRGLGLDVRLRHKKENWSSMAIDAEILFSDRRIKKYNRWQKSSFETLGERPTRRWEADISHHAGTGTWTSFARFSKTSDESYYRDLGEYSSKGRVAQERVAGFRYRKGPVSVHMRMQRYELLIAGSEPYRRSPEIDVTWNSRLGFLRTSVPGRFNRFTQEDSASAETAKHLRMHLQPNIMLPLAKPWGRMGLTAGIRHTAYRLDDSLAITNGSSSRTTVFGAVDGQLIFIRDAPEQKAIQFLEPRIFYFRESFESQDHLPIFDRGSSFKTYERLYSTSNFTTIDRIARVDRIALGVTARAINRASKREFARFSIGATHDFEQPRTTISADRASSGRFVSESYVRFTDSLSMDSTFAWSRYENNLHHAISTIRYKESENRLFHIGFRKNLLYDTEQSDLGFYWAVSKKWRAMGRWNHDWNHDQNVDSFAGLEYGSCCGKVRVLWRKSIRPVFDVEEQSPKQHTSLLLQIYLSSFRLMGSRVDSVLNHGLRGFERKKRDTNDLQTYYW